MNRVLALLAGLSVLAVALYACATGTVEKEAGSMAGKEDTSAASAQVNVQNLRDVYFAGGCFWGVEEYFSRIPGVYEAESGYANGTTENPSYEDVCYRNTGHAETVHVRYDPDIVSLKTLTAAETGLRRGRHGDFPDPRHLGGNDVHDHTGGQWGEPARNVEADPFDGDVAQPHPGALGQDRGGGVGITLQGFCDQAATPDGLLEGLPECRVELPGCPGQHPLRHPEGPGNHAVEALRVLCERLGSPVTDRVAHPPHRFHGSRDVQRRPGNVGAVVALEVGQVNRSKHGRSVYRRDPPGFRRRCWNGGRRFGPEGGEQHDGGDRAERSH